MTAPELNPCPRCGSDEISHGYSYPPMTGIVQCHADGCEIVTTSSSEMEAIHRWNKGIWDFKVVDRDDNGNPIYDEVAHDR